MKLAIIGSRTITSCDERTIIKYIRKETTAILSGGAKGVDAIAQAIAASRGIPFVEILPDYARYGRQAPMIRNCEIIRQADYVLAIWDFQSRGTAHAIACCIKEGVPVRILSANLQCSRPST